MVVPLHSLLTRLFCSDPSDLYVKWTKCTLTAEVIPSPGMEGDPEVLAGSNVDSHRVTYWSVVAVVLTSIVHTILQVRSRVDMLVTLSERPCLVDDNPAVLLVLIPLPLEVWTGLACCPLADGWTTWCESYLPALPQLGSTVSGLTIRHAQVILGISVVVATQTTDFALVLAWQFNCHCALPVKGHSDTSSCLHNSSPAAKKHMQLITVIQG